MANVLTVQLRPTKKYSAPSIANLFHNTGLSKATYWLKKADNIISNLDLKELTTRKAVNLWREWEQEAKEIIKQKKGRNPLKNQILVEEGLLIVGKDVFKKNPEIFIKIFEEFKKWFEEKYNTKIFAYFFHNHEGHFTEEGEFVGNIHIHFFFRNVDNKKGESVRRQIKKADLSKFQDVIYQIGKKYIPTLKRAKNYFKEGIKAPKHLSHNEFRTKKTKQMQIELIPKLKKENEELKKELAKVKDLKEENKRLRELLKKNKATREHYAELESFVKQLKEQVKAKELTLEELKEKMKLKEQELLEKIENLKNLAYSEKYKYDNGKPALNVDVAEHFKNKYKKEKEDKEKLKEELKREKAEKEKLKREKEALEEENKRLKREIINYYTAKITCYGCDNRRLQEKIQNREIPINEPIEFDYFNLILETKDTAKINFKNVPPSKQVIKNAILNTLKTTSWHIDYITLRGSEHFVETGKKAIEEIKLAIVLQQELRENKELIKLFKELYSDVYKDIFINNRRKGEMYIERQFEKWIIENADKIVEQNFKEINELLEAFNISTGIKIK